MNSDLSKEVKYKVQNYSVTLNRVPTAAGKLKNKVGLLIVRHPSKGSGEKIIAHILIFKALF